MLKEQTIVFVMYFLYPFSPVSRNFSALFHRLYLVQFKITIVKYTLYVTYFIRKIDIIVIYYICTSNFC